MNNTIYEKEIQLQCAEIMNKVREEHDIPKSIAHDELWSASETVTAAWCLMNKKEQKDRIDDLYGEAHLDLNGIQDYPAWLEATVMEALQASPIVYEPKSTEPTSFKAPKVSGFDSCIMTAEPQSNSDSEGNDNPQLEMSREEFMAALRIEPDQS
jgi:hypothetical protein